MPVIMNPSLLPTLATLRDLLDILAALRGASNPFGSLDGLRSAIALIVRLGTTLQINPKWLAWLQSAEVRAAAADVETLPAASRPGVRYLTLYSVEPAKRRQAIDDGR